MKCSVCGATGVRLWRTTHTLACNVDLFCVACALDREKERIGGGYTTIRSLASHLDSGSLGYLVAARPTEDGSFWGHSSGPQSSVAAWCALPFGPHKSEVVRTVDVARLLDSDVDPEAAWTKGNIP